MSYKVEKIIIYPIKSFAGIEVEKHKALTSGFEFDRRWMLIDEQNNFVTQRTNAFLALFKTKLTKTHLQISYKNETIEIDKFQQIGKKIKVKVWSHFVDAIEVNENANTFFSNILEKKVKLVKMNKESLRIKSLIVSPKKTDLSFADGYPFLILGTASINFLNKKLQEKIDYKRFRPNILITTEIEHEEDNWKNFKIANTNFRMVKPCVRCNVISINQKNAIQTKEPTATLANYRKLKNSLIFGMNAITKNENIITVNDKVSIL